MTCLIENVLEVLVVREELVPFVVGVAQQGLLSQGEMACSIAYTSSLCRL
jgi:hypothetical protein